MKKTVFYIVLVLSFFLFFLSLKAEETYPYYIEKYNVNMEVKENYTLDVSETIDVLFTKTSTCLSSYIPKNGYYTKENESRSKYFVYLQNVSSNNNTEVITQENQYIINSCSNSTFKEKETIIIKYTLKYASENNELFINIINNRWSTNIKKANFKISFFKPIDEDTIFLTTGTMYSTNTKNINYTYKNNVLSGKILSELKPYEGIKFKSYINNNYFAEKANSKIYDLIFALIILINVLIVYLIWYKNGKDYLTIDAPTYYPLKKYNSLEYAYIESECSHVSSKAVYSLIIYLANKGYIKIERNFNKIKLLKLKEYSSGNEIERIFMRELFKNEDLIFINESNKKFRKIAIKIKRMIKTKQNRNIILEKQADYLKIIPFILGIINVVLTIIIVNPQANIATMFATIFFTVTGFFLITTSLLRKKSLIRQTTFVLGVTIVILISSLTIYEVLNTSTYLLIYYIFGIMSYTVIVMFIYLMPKRSVEGNQLYSSVVNFKKFICSLNKDMINVLYKEDKNYFYNIISYAYALDIENILISKYEKVKKITHPKWYDDITDK